MRIGIVLLLFSNFFLSSTAQLSLTIEIDKLSNNKGQVLLELMDSKEEKIRGVTEKIENNKCIIVISNLKPGTYAFKYFHDENENEELDTNWIGMPTEGFGFSNNAKGKFGPPPLSAMIFDFKENKSLRCIPLYF